MSRDVMQQALDALDGLVVDGAFQMPRTQAAWDCVAEAINALRAALDAPEQRRSAGLTDEQLIDIGREYCDDPEAGYLVFSGEGEFLRAAREIETALCKRQPLTDSHRALLDAYEDAAIAYGEGRTKYTPVRDARRALDAWIAHGIGKEDA